MEIKRTQLSEIEKGLLHASVGDLLSRIEEEAFEVLHLKQTAFEWYSEKLGEAFHVQVIVTRDEGAFLEFLQTEVMRRYVKK